MNIGIDARLKDGQSGGVQQIIIGLAQGIREIRPSGLRLFFIMEEGHSDWLRPYLPDCGRVIEVRTSRPVTAGRKSFLVKVIRSMIGHTLAKNYYRLPSEPPEVDQYQLDLIHFVHQSPFRTDKPFIFMPQDLQYEYFPQYFSRRYLAVRKNLFKNTAEKAASVVCISRFTQRDVVKYLGIPEEKTKIIYCAPPTSGYGKVTPEGSTRVLEKYGLPEEFLLYPAKPFPHKNHKRLLSALSLLNKESSGCVNLVCTGSLTPYFHSDIEPLIKDLGLQERVTFTGFTPPNDLNHLYALSKAIVFPSEFEGFGMPVIEAFTFGKAVACSNASCLPEICADAALLFAPENVPEMASAIKSLLQNPTLRQQLKDKALNRASSFTWKQSAEKYLKLYEEILTETRP